MMASAIFMPLRAILRACKRFFEDAGQKNLSAHKNALKRILERHFVFCGFFCFCIQQITTNYYLYAVFLGSTITSVPKTILRYILRGEL